MKNIKEFIVKNIANLKTKTNSFSLDKLKAFLPKEKPRVIVGLDIGSFFVKAVGLRVEQGKSELFNFSVKQIDKEAISEVVNEVLQEVNIENKTINISLAGQGVVVRCVRLPKMSISEAKNAIGFESEKYIPFPLDEVFLDCTILKQLPEENKMLVLVAAAKKEAIQNRLNLLKKLELKPNVIDVDSIALANVLNRLEFNASPEAIVVEETKPKRAVALLNLGASFSSLCIIEDGLPKFVRDIFIGGNDLTNRISNILGLSLFEAEKTKCNPSSDWPEVIKACETILNNLINETRLSFDYFESEANIPIASLYLSGGGSQLKGIGEIFKSNLELETKILDPFKNLNINIALDKEKLKSQSQNLAVATGLALRLK